MCWGHSRPVRVVDGERDCASGGTEAEVKGVMVCVWAHCHVHPVHHHRRAVDVQHAGGEANHRRFKLDVNRELVVHAWCRSITKDGREDEGSWRRVGGDCTCRCIAGCCCALGQ